MVEAKIKALRDELERHNYNYYVLSAPTISDFEFDKMMKELQELEAAHPEFADPDSPTRRVGSDLSKEFEQVVHKYPMLSLGNTYSEDEIRDFYDRTVRSLNEPFEIVAELKYDGTSISLTYEKGRLTRAETPRTTQEIVTSGLNQLINQSCLINIEITVFTDLLEVLYADRINCLTHNDDRLDILTMNKDRHSFLSEQDKNI